MRGIEALTPWMVRVTLGGPEMEGFVVDEPAASVRLLLPLLGSTDLVMPAWKGNEFLLPDGSRPIIRTFTPRRVDVVALQLDVDVVVHEGGVASQWAVAASAGDPAAVSGPGRGYTVDVGAPSFLVAGDETAIPAVGQVLDALPAQAPVRVLVELAHPDARIDLPAHPHAAVEWLDRPRASAPGAALIAAIREADVESGCRVWAAGEAAAMQAIRRHLLDDRSLARSQMTVRGYWKHGRAGATVDG